MNAAVYLVCALELLVLGVLLLVASWVRRMLVEVRVIADAHVRQLVIRAREKVDG